MQNFNDAIIAVDNAPSRIASYKNNSKDHVFNERTGPLHGVDTNDII